MSAPQNNLASSNPFIGIILIVTSVALLPVMDSLVKILMRDLDLVQIIWVRAVVQTSIIVPVALHIHGTNALTVFRSPVHYIRAALLLAAMFCFFSAIRIMPIVDAVAIGFNYPLMIAALAPLVLGEQVGRRRWTAIIIGFAGALVMIRPGFREITPAILLALLSGVFFAAHLLLTRKLAGGTPASITLGFTSVFILASVSLFAPFYWQPPTTEHWIMLIMVGLLVTVCGYLMIRAYDYAQASLLAPFGYTELIFAALVSYLIFAETPDLGVFAGTLIVVASGIYISIRENRANISHV